MTAAHAATRVSTPAADKTSGGMRVTGPAASARIIRNQPRTTGDGRTPPCSSDQAASSAACSPESSDVITSACQRNHPRVGEIL
ncbi:hypothetical protein GCM10027535_19490 [Mycolicibacterium hippocampi]|uniref:Uncharacterized protein n=1 Tax=Mycolicibacterium hippocampi TaxID=659824 RepID=A0A7I9ZI63_9MYCO|nr:hypothetical protein MHIP_08500 [Mycolicibacterium hippocampi]